MPEPLTMMMTVHPSRLGRRQRGLSLIELMVGIAVGLVVVAGASFVVATQLTDNRRLLLETQLQQDLRASADIITRELRRSGANGDPAKVVYAPGGSPQPSAFADITLSNSDHQVVFDYRRDNQNGPFGFRLQGTAIQTLLGANWQALTDENTMRVTDFTVTALPPDVTVVPCPKACSADPLDTACWPTLTVRTYQVDISAQALSDATVQRSIRSQVRVRNNLLSFNDPALPSQACPA